MGKQPRRLEVGDHVEAGSQGLQFCCLLSVVSLRVTLGLSVLTHKVRVVLRGRVSRSFQVTPSSPLGSYALQSDALFVQFQYPSNIRLPKSDQISRQRNHILQPYSESIYNLKVSLVICSWDMPALFLSHDFLCWLCGYPGNDGETLGKHLNYPFFLFLDSRVTATIILSCHQNVVSLFKKIYIYNFPD